jgi:hypothetical protein
MLRAMLLAPLLLAAGPADGPVQALEGRYSRSYTGAMMTGEEYAAEKLVEIVPVSRTAAYFRIRTDWANGHVCSMWGVARAEKGRLVYRDPRPPYEKERGSCVLTIERTGGKLRIDDGNFTCKMGHCGMRGQMQVDLPFASRRPIPYLKRLRASPQYTEALTEWRTGKPFRR